MATPLKMASTSAMAATISMLLPFIVHPTVCSRIAASPHVGLDQRNRTMDMPPMILGNPAMINAYKSGILRGST